MIAEIETTTTGAALTAQIQRINLGDLHPSPTNPRKHFDAEALAELAGSIEEHGVKMPLLARPSKLEAGKYEIVAGERRYRACKQMVTRLPERMELAGDDTALVARLEGLHAERIEVPVIVEDLDDATVLELQLIENLQRRDLTALEEAHGYQRLIELPERAYTPAVIAQKIGKSVNTVLYKLKMLKAPKSLQEALDRGDVGERHLVLVASIPGQKQREECAKRVLKPQWGGVMSVRDTIRIINDDFRQSLKGAPWSLDDAEIDKNAGPCSMCPHFAKKAAEQDTDLAEELGNERGQTDPLTCMNPACFKVKQAAAWKQREALAKEGQVTVLKPKEAEKVIDDHGHLRHNANYVKLDDKPGYEFTGHYDDDKTPTWRELTEGRLPAGAVTVVNTKHDGIVEMIEKKLAIATAKEHPKHGKIFARVKESGKKELTAQEKKAKEKAAFETKVSARVKVRLLQHLYDSALTRGMDSETGMAVLESALYEAGMDGNRMICDWLKLEPTAAKKDRHTGQDNYRDAILKSLRDRDAGKPEVDAMIMIAVVSKWVKAYGLDISSLEPLQRLFGFDKKRITALAADDVQKENDAKAAKKKPVKVGKASKNSSDPTSFTVASEADKASAADKRAKKKTHGISGNAKDFAKAAELKAGKTDWKAVGNAAVLDAQAMRIIAGEGYPAVLGPRPAEATPERKKWESQKVALWKAVKKIEAKKATKKKAKAKR